jgi:hypothetical protein
MEDVRALSDQELRQVLDADFQVVTTQADAAP